MNNLICFDFAEHSVRVIERGNDPWFVATDVAAVLGYGRAPDMVRMLDDDEKGVHDLHTPGGQQQATIISESGLYACILRSQRPEARAFRKWVTSEVLPAIRKTGTYTVDPDVLAFIAGREELTVAEFFAAHPNREDSSETRRAVARDLRRQGFVRVYRRREA